MCKLPCCLGIRRSGLASAFTHRVLTRMISADASTASLPRAHSEVLLVGVQSNSSIQLPVLAVCREFRAVVVARNSGAMVLQVCGPKDAVHQFLAALPVRCVTHLCGNDAVVREFEATMRQQGVGERCNSR